MRILLMLLVIAMFTLSCKNKKTKSEKTQKETTQESQTNIPDPKAERTEWIKEMEKELSDSLFVRLQRTACFGRCPIYTLSIYKGGTVIYKGEKWVEKEGLYKSFVDQNVLKQIQKKANEIDFQSLDEVYDNINVTDLPSTIIVLKNEEGFKTVANRYGAPEKLDDFEGYIDKMVENLDWKKKEQ